MNHKNVGLQTQFVNKTVVDENLQKKLVQFYRKDEEKKKAAMLKSLVLAAIRHKCFNFLVFVSSKACFL